MKSKLITIVAALISTIAVAQDAALSYGVNGSYLLTNLNRDREVSYDLAQGYSVGIFVEYRPISMIGISGAVSFIQYGSNSIDESALFYEDEPLQNITGDVNPIVLDNMDLRFGGLNIPVIAHYYINDFIRINLGADYNLILDNSANVTYQPAFTETSFPINKKIANDAIDSRLLDHDLGLMAGAGVGTTLGSFTVRVDGYYRLGVLDINNRTFVDPRDNLSLHMNGFVINGRMAITLDALGSLF